MPLMRSSCMAREIRKSLQKRLHTQNGMILCGQNFVQLGGVARILHVVLVGNHVNVVVNAVELFSRGVDLVSQLLLQGSRHPHNASNAAFGLQELLGSNEVLAMAHVARRTSCPRGSCPRGRA